MATLGRLLRNLFITAPKEITNNPVLANRFPTSLEEYDALQARHDTLSKRVNDCVSGHHFGTLFDPLISDCRRELHCRRATELNYTRKTLEEFRKLNPKFFIPDHALGAMRLSERYKSQGE